MNGPTHCTEQGMHKWGAHTQTSHRKSPLPVHIYQPIFSLRKHRWLPPMGSPHCIRTSLGNMVACLGAGEHFFPTCSCPARYNAWAHSSRLVTRTKDLSMSASPWVAT